MLKGFGSPEVIRDRGHSCAKALRQDAACVGGAVGRLGGCFREDGLCGLRFQPSLVAMLQN